jgi:hypothetical protein
MPGRRPGPHYASCGSEARPTHDEADASHRRDLSSVPLLTPAALIAATRSSAGTGIGSATLSPLPCADIR